MENMYRVSQYKYLKQRWIEYHISLHRHGTCSPQFILEGPSCDFHKQTIMRMQP
jgi:hypothetical protein